MGGWYYHIKGKTMRFEDWEYDFRCVMAEIRDFYSDGNDYIIDTLRDFSITRIQFVEVKDFQIDQDAVGKKILRVKHTMLDKVESLYEIELDGVGEKNIKVIAKGIQYIDR